jgi:ribosome-associated toxin RatA of RatAB toxin-antitoxin module
MTRPSLLQVAGCAIAIVLQCPAVAGADTVRVEAHRDGDAVVVEALAIVAADARVAWTVLTDYDHYAAFVPDLKSSTVLARSGPSAIVEQRGVAAFFLFRFPLEVRLAVTEQPFHTVECRAIAGNFKEMTGVYRLTPVPEGIRFAYSGRLVPQFAVPPLIGLPLMRASVERQFKGLVEEILRREAQAGRATQ